jgi:hypothetical protein
MGFDIFGEAPTRIALVNIDTAEPLWVQYNPESFEEKIDVNWAQIVIPGLSHQPMQFTHTKNYSTKLELFFNAEGREGSVAMLDEARKWLMAACYPEGQAETIDRGGPPRILFVWPTIVSMEIVLNSLSFKHELFNLDMSMRQFRATLDMMEIRDTRITGADVRRDGTIRVSPAGR